MKIRGFRILGFLLMVFIISCDTANYQSVSPEGSTGEVINFISDIETPVVDSSPKPGELDVSTETSIKLTFDPQVSIETFSIENIAVSENGKTILGETVKSENIITFIPAAPFEYNSLVSAIIANLTDLSGKKINKLFSFSFTIQQEPDQTAPILISSTPLDGTIDVSVNSMLSFEFNETLDLEICVPDISLYNDNDIEIPASLIFEDGSKALSIKPDTNLFHDKLHHLEISEICDIAGNGASIEISFTTSQAPDITPPSDITLLFVEGSRASLTWSAPGDDGEIGKTTKYVIKKSLYPIDNEVEFDNAAIISNNISPKLFGEDEVFVLPKMEIGQSWYIAIRAYDEANNASSISSIALDVQAQQSFLVEDLADAIQDDYFGYALASNCDINGDGLSDFAIGSYLDDVAGVNTGRVFVYFGSTDQIGLGDPSGGRLADLVINGIDSNPIQNDDYFGYSLSCNHDFNGDGKDDILVGAPREDKKNSSLLSTNSGAAYLFYGKTFVVDQLTAADADVTFQGLIASDYFGSSVSGVGDLNNDGFDDIGIVSPNSELLDTDEGIVYIFYGSNLESGTMVYDATANIRLAGISKGSSNGLSNVVESGDIDGDGILDLALSAASYPVANKGTIYIFLGKNGYPSYIDLSDQNADITITGEDDNDYFGGNYAYKPAISISGDINADGINDLVIGAYQDDVGLTNNGAVYIFFGRKNWPAQIIPTDDADVIIAGATNSDYFGVSLDTKGDYNNDEIDDLLVGARTFANGGSYGGGFIFYGRKTFDLTLDLLDSDLIISSSSSNKSEIGLANIKKNDYLGNSLGFAGDVNGDGYDDIILGAYANETDGRPTNAGAAYLIH